jgi:hypothetical protein
MNPRANNHVNLKIWCKYFTPSLICHLHASDYFLFFVFFFFFFFFFRANFGLRDKVRVIGCGRKYGYIGN